MEKKMTEDELKDSWTDEFAPKTIEDMVLSNELKTQIKNLLNSKTKFSALFSGSAGIGKTSIARIIAKELNASVLFVQCGIDGTVSYAQTTIQNFCNSLSIEGKPKIVIMDELDCASGSQENSFQKTMRNIISESKDTIFIGTCNYPEKVIEPLQSRLGLVKLSFNPRELFDRVKMILDKKNIKYNMDSLKSFVTKILKTHYPDVRRIISDLQKYCASGELLVPDSTATTDDNFLIELIEKCKTEKNMLSLRQFYVSNKAKIEDYIAFSSMLFNYVLDNGLILNSDVVLRMTNIIYQMNVVIDREIQFFSLITTISKAIQNAK